MNRTLVILEVSRKQDYIFSSKKLRDNIARSHIIRYVTSGEFYHECAGAYYTDMNMVYSGGGHSILQFDTPQAAKAFAQQVTEAAMRRYDGLELFVKQMDYDASHTPGENLKNLSVALERKKSQRMNGFKRLTFGVDFAGKIPESEKTVDLHSAYAGWKFPNSTSELAGSDNFLAVVHIDGNAMGERLQKIYDASADNWGDCCRRLRSFSEHVQEDFEDAFLKMVDELICNADALDLKNSLLPIRPVILAGDDVCFVARGNLGIECARCFLEKLAALKNKEDNLAYAACAGVALVHVKYPFHRAYDLSEELCSSAKRFGAAIDRRISAIDWHIEFGQLKNSLSELRDDYETEDHQRVELRPLTVVVPEDITITREMEIRSYAFFRQICLNMKGEIGSVARSKIKDLRNAMKQGEVETSYFMHDKEISELVSHCFTARYRTREQQTEQFRARIAGQQFEDYQAFMTIGDSMRCLFFDAIEIIDHYTIIGEVKS